jgi:S-(hydroxymethyl)glutathione dehydrogenase/alcohol dehydrogenase
VARASFGASKIVVIDIRPKRLEEARRFGATDAIDSAQTNPVDAVRGLLPAGADHVFDFVGLKTVAEQGLEMLAVGGGLYLVGVARPDRLMIASLRYLDTFVKIDSAWLFSERLLYVDWIDERPLS